MVEGDARRRNTAPRSEETGQVVPQPRRASVEIFLRRAIAKVDRNPQVTVFPTQDEIMDKFAIGRNTILRVMKAATVLVEGEEVSLQAEVERARKIAEERRMAKRDAPLVDWFFTPPDDLEDTTPRIISTAVTVFGQDRSLITAALARAGRLDEVKERTKGVIKEVNAKTTAEIQERKRREKEEELERKKFEPEPSEELAWFLGMVTAAGRMSGPRSGFTGVNFALGQRFDDDVLAALQSSSNRFLGRFGNFRDRGEKGIELHLDHTEFARWLGPFNRGARVDTLRQERYAWLLQPPFIKPYLEGIFDAKGNIQIKGTKAKAYIYVLKSRKQEDAEFKLELSRFYREVLIRFGLESPYLFQRPDKLNTAMGVIVYNNADLALLATLQSKSREKQAVMDELRALTMGE